MKKKVIMAIIAVTAIIVVVVFILFYLNVIPLQPTIEDIKNNPEKYEGKKVKLEGRVGYISVLHDEFTLHGDTGSIQVDYKNYNDEYPYTYLEVSITGIVKIDEDGDVFIELKSWHYI